MSVVGVGCVQVVRGGMEDTNKALVVVGNRRGGIGYGVGRHKKADRAVELAIAAAERDMIFVATYRGQLYHDLVGKKNNVYVLLKSRPPAYDSPRAHWLVQTVLEMAGVRHAMAAIKGAKRRNAYTVVQALFNAFETYRPFDHSAKLRGQRILHVGEDRFGPQAAQPVAGAFPSWASRQAGKTGTGLRAGDIVAPFAVRSSSSSSSPRA